MMKRGHDIESAPSIWRRRTAREQYAGIDVSFELSSVCIVDAQGKIVKEAKVASEPEALVGFFETLGFAVDRPGGRTIVAVAACGVETSRIRRGFCRRLLPLVRIGECPLLAAARSG
jgi:hypothetical protein